MSIEIGDPVLFHSNGKGPFAATVCKVHVYRSETFQPGPAGISSPQPFACVVNVAYFTEEGHLFNKIGIPFFEDGEEIAAANYCKRKPCSHSKSG
jgi:hypothetical protein